MAPPAKYHRATIHSALKGHSQKRVSRDVDALIYLNYVAFMDELMKNAERKSNENGEQRMAARDIRKATNTTLKKFKG